MNNIIIIEDDTALARGIELALREDSRKFTVCHNLSDAKQALSDTVFDLMLLDISLPDGTGLDFCREIRDSFPAPIIFITANDTEMDIVAGLELGGDDYITKPFSLAVLRARVNAQLRRGSAREAALRFGNMTFDFERLLFTKNARSIALSKTEQRLLHLLVSNPGQTVTRERLLDYIWPDGGDFVDENALSVAISRLRSKIEDDSSLPAYIKTVRGIGYCWAVKP